MDLQTYRHWRERMGADDWGFNQLQWSRTVTFPVDPDVFAKELIWVILNSGMKSAVARRIYDRIAAAWVNGKPTSSAFKHTGKVAAIEHIWNNRAKLHAEAKALTPTALVEWCETLPWIGGITKYHAAKNLGADVAKPDRWLERVAARYSETVNALCERLSGESGDRIATVDLVIWWACAHGGYRP